MVAVAVGEGGDGDDARPWRRRGAGHHVAGEHEVAKMVGAELTLESHPREFAGGQSHDPCVVDENVEGLAACGESDAEFADGGERGEIEQGYFGAGRVRPFPAWFDGGFAQQSLKGGMALIGVREHQARRARRGGRVQLQPDSRCRCCSGDESGFADERGDLGRSPGIGHSHHANNRCWLGRKIAEGAVRGADEAGADAVLR